MKRSLFFLIPFCLTCCFSACSDGGSGASNDSTPITEVVDYWEQEDNYGLHVKDGFLTLGGKNFYGIGANCFNLFNNGLSDNYSTDNAYQSLKVLKDHGVPVVRFNCGVYYGPELAYYGGKAKTRYLTALAEVAEMAEELKIGLIPSFFWHIKTVPDYVGERVIDWGIATSQTRAFMTEYTTDIVNTLKGYKSIFGWEFGNEFNLQADLPIDVFLSSMSAEDAIGMLITSEGVIDAYNAFTELVCELDPHGRIITSGNASLRNAQYNLQQSLSWELDTQEEHDKMNLDFHPANMNVVSEHNYFFEYDISDESGNKVTLSLYEYMKNAVKTYRDNGKAYFVGEFGADTLEGNTPQEKYALTEEMFRTMMSTRVQLSLVWNFDILGVTEYSFTDKDERGQYILYLLKSCNEEYQDIVEDDL